MDGRTDLARAQGAAAKELDALRGELAARCAAVIEGIGDGPMTPLRQQVAMAEIDRVLDEFYGRWPGDRQARLLPVILRGTARAREAAFARSDQLAARLERRARG